MKTGPWHAGGSGCGSVWLTLAFVGLLSAGPLAAYAVAGSRETVSLQELSRSYGFQSLSVRGKRAVLATRFHTLELERDSRRATFDGITIWLNGPVEKSWGRLVILRDDARKTILPLINPEGQLTNAGFGLVVLDAGHGGADRGTSGLRLGMDEKRLTLEIVRDVGEILGRYRVPVRLTRADDRAVPLEERSRLAADWKADVFVSVHFNAAANSQSKGIETYILAPAGCPSTAEASAGNRERAASPGNKFDPANMALGYTMHQRLLKYTKGEDRGLKRSRFVVIRNAPCPAALVECGFMSHQAEEQKIMTPAYRKAVARGIAEAILAYLNAVKRAHHLNP